MVLHSVKRRKSHRFFFRAITKLFCKKLRDAAYTRFLSENAPGDNFPGLYWRSA